ncbi:DUF4974 domain-containing protein [Chitinophaga sedimenti]|nr:DUF4974 domain-containing protein [Chitinophaga sedimenti]
MKQLERWYDIDVVYEGSEKVHLNGTFSRNMPLSKILDIFESTKLVHFKIEGRTLTVTVTP